MKTTDVKARDTFLVVHKGVLIHSTKDEKNALATFERARKQWPDDEVKLAVEVTPEAKSDD